MSDTKTLTEAVAQTTQHTQGIWREGTGWIYADDNSRTHICTIPNYPYGASEANARLIAAAPELLEVAKLAAKLCALITAWADAEREKAFGIMDEIVDLAQDNDDPRNIIAKATKA